jgi:hypothetical protein
MSVGRGNNRRSSGYSYRSVCPKSNDQIALSSKDPLINNEGQKNSSECDNAMDRQCSKNSEAVNMGNASQDCVVGSRKKVVEVALNGVAGVKASESMDLRRNNSQSVQSTVNGGRRYNAQPDHGCQFFSCSKGTMKLDSGQNSTIIFMLARYAYR